DVAAPSTLGTFLRAFTFGHVRKLDRVLAESLSRAWLAGGGPGDQRLVVDVDSFVGEVFGADKQGAGYGYTHTRGYHPIIATRAGTGEVLHIRARKGSANTSRGALRFVEELIPRVARAGATGPKLLRADSGFWNHKIMARLQAAGWAYSIGGRQQQHIQAEIWPDWRHFAFLTNRTDALELVESEHRQHAVVELAIRDLKDQALAHFPSGKFLANAAWTVIAALAHNLLRWTTLIGLPDTTIPTARTARRRLLTVPGRITRTARQLTLRMPARWPWEHEFLTALQRLRTVPPLTCHADSAHENDPNQIPASACPNAADRERRDGLNWPHQPQRTPATAPSADNAPAQHQRTDQPAATPYHDPERWIEAKSRFFQARAGERFGEQERRAQGRGRPRNPVCCQRCLSGRPGGSAARPGSLACGGSPNAAVVAEARGRLAPARGRLRAAASAARRDARAQRVPRTNHLAAPKRPRGD